MRAQNEHLSTLVSELRAETAQLRNESHTKSALLETQMQQTEERVRALQERIRAQSKDAFFGKTRSLQKEDSLSQPDFEREMPAGRLHSRVVKLDRRGPRAARGVSPLGAGQHSELLPPFSLGAEHSIISDFPLEASIQHADFSEEKRRPPHNESEFRLPDFAELARNQGPTPSASGYASAECQLFYKSNARLPDESNFWSLVNMTNDHGEGSTSALPGSAQLAQPHSKTSSFKSLLKGDTSLRPRPLDVEKKEKLTLTINKKVGDYILRLRNKNNKL